MILYIISQIYYSAWHIKSIISDSKDIFIAIQKKSNKSYSFNNFINTVSTNVLSRTSVFKIDK